MGIEHTINVRSGIAGLLYTYLRVFLTLFSRPTWAPRAAEAVTLPKLKATCFSHSLVRPAVLHRFRNAAGWPNAGQAPTGSSPGDDAPKTETHVPVTFLVSQTFRLAMAILFSPWFPYQVLGRVLNHRARYSLLKNVTAGDTLEHKCELSPTTHLTPSGHLEFDLLLTSHLVLTGELAWQCTLTMVMLNPSVKRNPKPKSDADVQPAPATGTDAVAPPADATDPALVLLPDLLHLGSGAGRTYAALDGDLSPMHLWGWTAKLVGFPKPVANVHHVMAKLEVALAEALGTGNSTGIQLPVPATLKADFKSPTLLPARLQVWVQGSSQASELLKLASSSEGLQVKVARVARQPQGSGNGKQEEQAGKEVVVATLLLGAAT